MTSSPEVGADASLAAGAAAAGDDAAGVVAAVELSCASAAMHQKVPPSARAHAIDLLIIFVRKSPGTFASLSRAACALNCGGWRGKVSGVADGAFHWRRECRRSRAPV